MLTAVTRAVSRSIGACELTWLDRRPIDIDRAIEQHHQYVIALAEAGARVVSLPALENHPDAVFVEDPAIVLDEVAVITSMGIESRRGECESLAATLTEFRPLIRMRGPAKLEGGDVMRIGSNLFCGLSARTDAAGVSQLREALAPYGYKVYAVDLRDCLHLKSACTYTGDGYILANRNWFDTSAFAAAQLDPVCRFLDVPPDEPGGANALRIGNTVLLPDAFPRTADVLRRAGFNVRTLDLSELLKAESGVTCSSLVFEA